MSKMYIPKKIHLIFHKFKNGKDFEEYPIFIKCLAQQEKLHKDYEIKVWGSKETLELIESKYPKYVEFYKNLRFDIQRVDFARMCILHAEGGLYFDLDVYPLKPITPLVEDELLVLHNLRHVKKTYGFVENDFMCSIQSHPFWEYAMAECVKNYQEKSKVKIYDQWKARFVMQTTGPKFMGRVIKDYDPSFRPVNVCFTKFNTDSPDKYYIKDYQVGSWIEGGTTHKDNKIVAGF